MDTAYYDRLAPLYHLLYSDWEHAITRQGAALAGLLAELDVHPGAAVRDVACGIGTQTIGLLRRGYRVTASDLSPGAVARAQAELLCRGLDASVTVADMRDPGDVAPGQCDALIACDNAVPHLADDGEILAALRRWRVALRPGGALVLSVRDYAALPRRSPDVRPHALRHERGRQVVAVQVWEWDGDRCDVRLYLTEERDGVCTTELLVGRHHAVTVPRLLELAGQAGFARAERRDGVLFQPVVVAVR